MITEKFSESNWCRPSNAAVAPDDICRFPHAVLEVKLQLEMGEELPEWVDSLMNSGLILEVPKFSKFIHGCATLLPDDVRAFPFWLDTVHAEYEGWEGSKPKAGGNRPSSADKQKELAEARESLTKRFSEKHKSGLSEPLLGNAVPKPKVVEPARRRTVQSQQSWWEQCLPFKNPLDKPLKVPVRVEPKTYFANERTFLSWLNMAVLLSSVAVGLIGLGGSDDLATKYGGIVLLAVGLFFAVYAICMFHWRANKIRARDGRPYDDRFGPTVLVVALIGSLLFNFMYTWRQSQTINP